MSNASPDNPRGYPRNANGEYGRWQGGSCFTPWQGEWHKLEGRHASIHAQFGIVPLENGEWLSGLSVWDDRHPTREAALKAAAEEVIERATMLSQPSINGDHTFPPQIGVAEANAIITWASGEIGKEPPLVPERPEPPPVWADLPLFRNQGEGPGR
jgi:hypothetical protein